MRPLDVASILWKRAALRSHEHWSRSKLEAYQADSLARLLSFARTRSPYYGRVIAPGANRLDQLPVLTKQTMMGRFDEIVTDPAVRLRDLDAFLHGDQAEGRYLGRYEVATTSGSSGVRSVVPASPSEWTTTVASYARANEWAGIRVSPLRPSSGAVVSSVSPMHQSTRVGRTVATPFFHVSRFDAGRPVAETVAALNEARPEILIGYASMLRILADEQVAGRLRIAPRVVNASSEVLTVEGRRAIHGAFGVEPFEVYATTEAAGIAAECDRHQGLHVFEDLVVLEVVDDDYRPVPAGTTGTRALVTVLSSRTLPLIRFELTDRVRVSTNICPCGRPLRLIESIEGRTDDALLLPGKGGGDVRVHPVVFHAALDAVHGAGWQVRQERGGLRVLLAGPRAPSELEDAALRLGRALSACGVGDVRIEVVRVDAIEPGASGKRPLVARA